MKPVHIAVLGVLVSAILAGVSDVIFERSVGAVKLMADFGPLFIALAFIFIWLHYDNNEYSYRRSALLNIGIVALAVVFVPVYLARSRPAGRRMRAVLAFLGLFVLWGIIVAISIVVTERVAT